jgi:hypothetical protein
MENLKRVLDAHAKSIIDGLGAKFDSHDFIEQFLTEHRKECVGLFSGNIFGNEIFKTVHAGIDQYLSDNASALKIEKIDRTQGTNIREHESENQEWRKVFAFNPLLGFLGWFSVLC